MSRLNFDDELDAEREELRAQDRADRAYNRALIAHPHPADPDFPGPRDPDGSDE
jgi:hypothetical protein